MNLETIRNIIRMFSFYKRKTVFFALALLLMITGVYFSRQLTVTADQPITSTVNSGVVSKSYQISENGTLIDTTDNGRKVGQVNLVEGKDELRQVIMDRPGLYLDLLTVQVSLPSAVAKDSEAKFLAIHGVDSADAQIIDDQTIIYTARNVGPQAELTAVLTMPSGTINYPLAIQAKNALGGLSFSFWLLLAITLPLLTLLILLYIIFKELRSSVDLPTKEINSPPMALPPAIVGVIVKQKIGPREIAATLIDLAIRGDIVIVDRERGFSFGKNRLEQSLIGYEKILLGKIFKNALSASQKEVDERVNRYLYSKKVSAFYYLIQVLAYRMGYLKANYRRLKSRYSLLGILLFLIGVAGFLLKVFSVSSAPPYSLFFWIGMIVASVIIFALADYIPSRSEIGRAEATNWLAFKRYLSSAEAVEFDEANYDLFTRFLPYAVVLECEAAWAQRFAKHNFRIPDWFLTDKNAVGLEDFCLLLFPIVSYVGQNLDTLKEPGI